MSAAEVVRRDAAGRRAGRRVLAAPGAPQTGGAIRALGPVPLPDPLLLRSARGPRLHDGTRLRGRSTYAVRPLRIEGEKANGRPMGSGCRPPGHRRQDGRVVQEESEGHADAVRARKSGGAEQDDHAPRDACPEAARTSDVTAAPRVPAPRAALNPRAGVIALKGN